MSNITLIIVIIVAVLIVAALVIAGYQMARKRRTEQLRQQYGPEYDRAIDQSESQSAAESERNASPQRTACPQGLLARRNVAGRGRSMAAFG